MTKTDRVAEAMRRKIASEEWKVEHQIPGLHDLAGEFRVSFGTVRAAQQILVCEGLLSQPEQGVSTRVLRKPPALDTRETLRRLRAAYRSLGEELEHLAATLPVDGSMA